MPYINQHDRDCLDNGAPPAGPGELNYLITKLLLQYVELNGKRYRHINDCLGALEGAKLEFYRRYVAPYEDEKVGVNGDVY